MKISKNKKICFFLMSQGSFNQKIRFLGQNVFSVARGHTDRHESDYSVLWAPFQGFRSFSFNLSSRIGPILTTLRCTSMLELFDFHLLYTSTSPDILMTQTLDIPYSAPGKRDRDRRTVNMVTMQVNEDFARFLAQTHEKHKHNSSMYA